MHPLKLVITYGALTQTPALDMALIQIRQYH